MEEEVNVYAFWLYLDYGVHGGKRQGKGKPYHIYIGLDLIFLLSPREFFPKSYIQIQP